MEAKCFKSKCNKYFLSSSCAVAVRPVEVGFLTRKREEVGLQQTVVDKTVFERHIPHSPIPRDVKELALESGVCMDCTDPEHPGELKPVDGDVVCPKCGVVWAQAYSEDRIPFSDDSVSDGHSENNYSPEGNMDWSKGLGARETAGDIADALGGKGARKDPFYWKRAQSLRVKLTHPVIQTLLSYGSRFCENVGLHTNSEEDIRFGDRLGQRLRSFGVYVVVFDSKHNLLTAASAIFASFLRGMYPQKYENFRGKFPELSLDERFLDYYDQLVKSFPIDLLPELPSTSENGENNGSDGENHT
jgi:hypothetical protein